MAVISEFLQEKMRSYTQVWKGKSFRRKPDPYAPYNKAFVVIPRKYVGSKDCEPALILNCADGSDAKQTYYAEMGIDPLAQYTDVQRYEPTEAAETAGSNNPTKRANVRVVE